MGIWGSGFITQIIYAAQASAEDDFSLLTENNLNILTEAGQDIDIEH